MEREVLGPYLAFSDYTPVKGLGGGTSIQPHKGGSIDFPPGLGWREWEWGHSLFCGIWLKERLSSKSFLSFETAPVLFLWIEKAAFLFFFSLSPIGLISPIGLSVLLVSLAPSLGYRKQRENQGTRDHVISQVSTCLSGLPSALHLPKSSNVCFRCNAQGF